jgi:hypothetical protein
MHVDLPEYAPVEWDRNRAYSHASKPQRIIDLPSIFFILLGPLIYT